MPAASVLLVSTLVIYSTACVLCIWSLASPERSAPRAAWWTAAVGFAAHAAGIVVLWFTLERAPFTNLHESLIFLAWALVGLYLAMARRGRIGSLGVLVMLGAVCIVVAAMAIPKGVSTALLPALRSRWSVIHVASCLVSYASFVLAFLSALGYMVQGRLLKTKRKGALQGRLPALDLLDNLAYKLVSLGFPMLTLGIVTGAMWAQTAWNSYWNWDPKETWALITWLIYAAYLHVRIVQGWRGKWANRLLVIGFMCVLVTFLGVNFLARGLHNYNW